jgi:hypothetical protein
MKKATSTLGLLLVAVLAIVGISYVVVNSPGWGLAGQTVSTQELAGPVNACTGGQSQSMDINAYNHGTPTTAVTEANNIHREVGETGSLGAVTFGTAITTLQPGTDIEIIGGVSGTAANNYDNSYTPHVIIENLPCVVSKNLVLFEDEVEGSITATFYNSNHDASAETLVASTPTIVSLRFYTADEQWFGNPYLGEPSYLGINWNDLKVDGVTYVKGETIGSHRPQYPNILCLQLNTTTHDQPIWVKALLQDGSKVEMNAVNVPQVHTAAANDKDYCYEAPILSGTFIEMEIKINPASTVGTLVDDTASFYAGHRFMHTDTGVISWGVEDNDGAAVGASNPDTLTLDWTA